MNLNNICIIDIGVNLGNPKFDADRAEVVKRAHSESVNMILTGTSLESSKDMVENLTVEHNLVCTVGIHPHHANTYHSDTTEQLFQLIKQGGKRVVAVGETGLDYNRMFSTKGEQIYAFNNQIQLALKLNMPLFLHCREAHRDFINALDLAFRREGKQVPCVVHCFTGTIDEAEDYIERGYYIGLTGYICNRNRAELVRKYVVPEIPLDRILVETDAPFMSPYPKVRCEPIHVREVVEEIAYLRGINFKKCRKQILQNTKTFFNF